MRLRVLLGALACVAFAGVWACKEEPTTPPPAKDTGTPPAPLVQDGSLSMMPSFSGLFDASDDGWPVFGILGMRPSPIPKDFVVDMVNDTCATGCKGDIHIEADGHGTLKRQGKTEPLTIELTMVGALVTAIDTAKFFDMKPEYGRGAPMVTITVSMNQNKKSVRHMFGDAIAAPPPRDGGLPAMFGEDRERLLDLQSHINFAANTGRTDGMQFPEKGVQVLEKLFARLDAGLPRDAR
jgi:hypothetical protein